MNAHDKAIKDAEARLAHLRSSNAPRNRLCLSYGPADDAGGRTIVVNGMDLSWNVHKDSVSLAYDNNPLRGAALVTLTLVVDDLNITSEETRPDEFPANRERYVQELSKIRGEASA